MGHGDRRDAALRVSVLCAIMIIPEHLEATVVDLIAWCFYPRIIYVVINGKTCCESRSTTLRLL